MIYCIHQLDLSEDYANDPMWKFSPKEIPGGGYILPRHYLNAINGEPFKVYGEDGGMPVEYKSVEQEDYVRLMTHFTRCELWGLPNGNGWINEHESLLTFLLEMKNCKAKIEEWHQKKASRGNG